MVDSGIMSGSYGACLIVAVAQSWLPSPHASSEGLHTDIQNPYFLPPASLARSHLILSTRPSHYISSSPHLTLANSSLPAIGTGESGSLDVGGSILAELEGKIAQT